MMVRSFLAELKYKKKRCVYGCTCMCIYICAHAHMYIYVHGYTYISFQEKIENNLNCLQMLKITWSMYITHHEVLLFLSMV